MKVLIAQTKKDINEGLSIIGKQFGYTLQEAQDMFSEEIHTLIILKNSNNIVVGALLYKHIRKNVIYVSYIVTTLKRMNIGKLLLTSLETNLLMENYGHFIITADVRIDNLSSILLFKTAGYDIKTTSTFYNNGTQALSVKKRLFIIH